MIKLTAIAPPETTPNDVVTLNYEARQKFRLLSATAQGAQIGVFLPRHQSLRAGHILTGPERYHVLIEAAPESLSVLRCDDPLLFARACYHLGNRHVALQILPGELRYLSDHVLDAMVAGLGLAVSHETLPFEPELGAYHNHGH
jgi:urease accessory protein